jgi:cell division protein FtsL
MEEKGENIKKKSNVKSFMNGEILIDEHVTKHVPFILFLGILGFLLIANRNWAEHTNEKVNKLKGTIYELRSESVTISAKLMDASRQSEVLKRVKRAGIELNEQTGPIKEIYVNKN